MAKLNWKRVIKWVLIIIVSVPVLGLAWLGYQALQIMVKLGGG